MDELWRAFCILEVNDPILKRFHYISLMIDMGSKLYLPEPGLFPLLPPSPPWGPDGHSSTAIVAMGIYGGCW